MVEMGVHEKPAETGWGLKLQFIQSLISTGDSLLYHLMNIDDGVLNKPRVIHGLMAKKCPWRKQ